MTSERKLRDQIVRACEALSRKNLVSATDGNLTARLGENRILVTPSGVNKGEVRARDILICDLNGRKIRGAGKISSEIQVHLAAYRVRKDIRAVVHAHPPVATAFTFAGMEKLLLEPVVPEVVAQIGPIPTAPYITPGTRELADAAARLFRKSDIVMLARHGAVTLGADPRAAYLRMEKLEYLAVVLKTAYELAGGSKRIRRFSKVQTAELRSLYG